MFIRSSAVSTSVCRARLFDSFVDAIDATLRARLDWLAKAHGVAGVILAKLDYVTRSG
ncbi:hypothetical protein [Burkholderia metallica]|uniref:hypothetical protein n=1 Tax=Burkholderia metallica TaxID=488729 RepID=UPI00157B1B42|nr:hypothetical protein [Burkholderia metallica]